MDNKKEFSNFIYKYISGKEIVYSENISLKNIREIIDIIYNGKDFEHPDGYSLIENELFMIEHFQFDASIEKKGSTLITDKKKIISEINKEIQTKEFVNKSLKTKSSVNDYYLNLKNHFIKHANQFEKYKIECSNWLKTTLKCNSLILFIEDKTIFGALNNNNNNNIAYEIIKTKEFMELWKEYPNVKAIFLGGNMRDRKYCRIYLYEETQNNYETIENHNPIIMNDMQIIECKMEVKKDEKN